MSAVLHATVRDRKRAWVWWAAGVVAMNAFVVSAYGSIRDQAGLQDVVDDLPDGIRALIGAEAGLSITSAAGYLNGRIFSNTLPILLSVFGIGFAARAIAGEENAGRLELLLAHPVARVRVLGERALAVGGLLVGLAVVGTASLLAMTPLNGLDAPGLGKIVAACTGAFSLALLHTAVTYGAGAWAGNRGVAVAVGSTLTAGGFLVQSVAASAPSLRGVRWLSAWHWFVDARPIVDGWGPMLLPALATLALSAAAVGLGAWRFRTRDIGSA